LKGDVSRQLAELRGGKVRTSILGVREDEVDPILVTDQIIDHADATPLAPAGPRPPEFAQTSGARNQVSRRGPEHERQFQLEEVRLVQHLAGTAGEGWQVNKFHSVQAYANGGYRARPISGADASARGLRSKSTSRSALHGAGKQDRRVFMPARVGLV
jgi:hypothetical protein